MPLTVAGTYYALDEVGEELGLALNTVRNYAYSGALQAVRVGNGNGTLLVSETELNRFRSDRRTVMQRSILKFRPRRQRKRPAITMD